MNIIRLSKEEFKLLMGVILTVDNVFHTPDMEAKIGGSDTLLELKKKIKETHTKESGNSIVVCLTDFEMTILSKTMEFAIQEMEESECDTLLGFDKIDVIQMNDRIVHGGFFVPDFEVKEVAEEISQEEVKCPICAHVLKDRLHYPIVFCLWCETNMYNPLFKDVVHWHAESSSTYPYCYKIKEIPHLGCYLYQFDGKTRKQSYTLKTLEEAKTRAKEEFGIPQELWKRVV